MAQQKYDDTNTGILGSNDYKQKENHPDQRGRANVGGLWYWISGWDKNKGNRSFTSLAFTLMTQDEVDKMLAKRAEAQRPQQQPQGQQQQQPQQRPQQQQQAPQQQQNPDSAPNDFDDDIPF